LVVVYPFLYSNSNSGIVKFTNYGCIQMGFVKLKVENVCMFVVFSNMCRAYTICAHLRVVLSVMFRSGRGLRKDRQIKPLSYIDLSYNALKIELRSDWQPPSRLTTAHFAACQMGPMFPGWLQWHVSITDLDISSAGIADRLPQWFSDAFRNVELLNISNNQLSGGLPTNMSYMSLSELISALIN